MLILRMTNGWHLDVDSNKLLGVMEVLVEITLVALQVPRAQPIRGEFVILP